MSEGARVTSVEALRPLRAGLLEFCREVSALMASADSEIARMVDWLGRDRVAHWRGEVQRRGEMLARAKSDLYRAQIQKKSLVDEKKAINRAKQALDEAQARLEAARKWAVRLEHERALYAGAVNGLNVAASVDLPKAAAKLEIMSRSLDDYIALTTGGVESPDDSPGTIREAMSRPGGGGVNVGATGMPTTEAIVSAVRALLPGALERESAPGAEAAGVGLGTRRVSALKGELTGDEVSVGERMRVILDARFTREELIFLVRDDVALAGDSGWFVTPAPGTAGEARLVATSVGALAEAWPGLASVWGMPAGTVIALEGEQVRVVWPSGTIAPTKEGRES